MPSTHLTCCPTGVYAMQAVVVPVCRYEILFLCGVGGGGGGGKEGWGWGGGTKAWTMKTIASTATLLLCVQ